MQEYSAGEHALPCGKLAISFSSALLCKESRPPSIPEQFLCSYELKRHLYCERPNREQ